MMVLWNKLSIHKSLTKKRVIKEHVRNSYRDHDQDEHGEGPSNGRRRGRPLLETQCFYSRKYEHTMKYCKKQEDESEDTKFMHEQESKEVETVFMAFASNELVEDDVLNNFTAKDVMFKAVDDALHSNFGNLDDMKT